MSYDTAVVRTTSSLVAGADVARVGIRVAGAAETCIGVEGKTGTGVSVHGSLWADIRDIGTTIAVIRVSCAKPALMRHLNYY